MTKPVKITEKVIDELVDEIVEMVANTKNFPNILQNLTRYEEQLEQLKTRVDSLEKNLREYIYNFKIVSVESERLITEKTEKLGEENEETKTRLLQEIVDLRTTIKKLSVDVNKVRLELEKIKTKG